VGWFEINTDVTSGKHAEKAARTLKPFDDVNKRVSRLGANIPFIKNNLSPLSFTDVPRSTYTGESGRLRIE